MSSFLSKFGMLPVLLPAILGPSLLIPASVAQEYRHPSAPAAQVNANVAQNPLQASQQIQASQVKPEYQVAERSTLVAERAKQILAQRSPNEHPLMPCLRWAYDGIDDIERIQDYQARMVKRERINGELGDYESIFVKVRHKPFSVYMYFLGPEKKRGQEVMYSEASNEGKMQAHGVGIQKMFGTVSLDPTGQIAMNGNRYPITEVGLLTLVRRLIEVAEEDVKYGECEVKFYPGAKIEDRICTCIQVVHPTPRRNFRFHVARIYVDDELNLPVRYEAYDWPEQEGGKPQLLEEYTYLNLKLNNGFTDADFDVRNPNYQFNVK